MSGRIIIFILTCLLTWPEGRGQWTLRELPAAGMRLPLPDGMKSRPFPVVKHNPLLYWLVRSDSLTGSVPWNLQLFEFQHTDEADTAAVRTALQFIYRAVWDTACTQPEMQITQSSLKDMQVFLHRNNIQLTKNEEIYAIIYFSFRKPNLHAWVWSGSRSFMEAEAARIDSSWQKLEAIPKRIVDAGERLTYLLDPEWAAILMKDSSYTLIPRTQINKPVLEEKMGYHSLKGYIFQNDSTLLSNMKQSLELQGFTIIKTIRENRFSGFEIRKGEVDGQGTYGLYLFWPPSGRMLWPYGMYYLSTTPLNPEKTKAFLSFLESLRFLEPS